VITVRKLVPRINVANRVGRPLPTEDKVWEEALMPIINDSLERPITLGQKKNNRA